MVAQANNSNVDSLIACRSFELSLLLMNKMRKRIYWSISGVADEGRCVQVHIPAHTGPPGLQLCRPSALASVFGSNKQMATRSDFLKVTSLWVLVLGQTPDKSEAIFILWKTIRLVLIFYSDYSSFLLFECSSLTKLIGT